MDRQILCTALEHLLDHIDELERSANHITALERDMAELEERVQRHEDALGKLAIVKPMGCPADWQGRG